jgi:hypothetical protein
MEYLAMRNWGIALLIVGILVLGLAAESDPVEPNVTFGEQAGASVQPIESSVWIDATPQEVWDHAVKDIDGWWPHCYKPESRIWIEQWVGGRIWEQFDESGQGGLYGHVLYIDEPVVMKMDGQWGMPGAAVSGGVWRFTEQDSGTLFTMKGEIMGKLSTEGLEARKEGHRDVLLRLKHFVETDERIDRKAELEAAERAAEEAAAAEHAAGGGH